MRLNVVNISFISHYQSDHLATAVRRVQAVDAQVRLLVFASAGCKCDLYQNHMCKPNFRFSALLTTNSPRLRMKKIRANDVSIRDFANAKKKKKKKKKHK